MSAVNVSWQCTGCGRQGSVTTEVRDLGKNETIRPLYEQHDALKAARAATDAAYLLASPACTGLRTGRVTMTFGRSLLI